MGMTAGSYNQSDRDFLKIWWIIWAAVLFGLGAIYFALGRRPLPPGAADDKTLTGLIGLVISSSASSSAGWCGHATATFAAQFRCS